MKGGRVLPVVSPREFAVTEETVSIAIVDAIADMESTTAADVEPPLYEAVDPDALDRLFAPTDGSQRITGRVRFEYGSYDVSVSSAGLVRITAGTGADDARADSATADDPESDGVDEAL